MLLLNYHFVCQTVIVPVQFVEHIFVLICDLQYVLELHLTCSRLPMVLLLWTRMLLLVGQYSVWRVSQDVKLLYDISCLYFVLCISSIWSLERCHVWCAIQIMESKLRVRVPYNKFYSAARKEQLLNIRRTALIRCCSVLLSLDHHSSARVWDIKAYNSTIL